MPASSAYVRPYRSSTTAISFSAIPGSAFWRKEGGAGSSHAPPDGSVVSRSRADVCQHGPGILFDGEVADGDDADRPAVLADRQPPHRLLADQHVADVVLAHLYGGVDERGIRGETDGIGGHRLSDQSGHGSLLEVGVGQLPGYPRRARTCRPPNVKTRRVL